MIDQRTSEQPVRSTAGNAINGIVNTVEGAVKSVSPALHKTADQVSDLANAGMGALRDGSRRLGEQARRASDNTVAYVRHDPIKSALIVAGIATAALAIARLLRGRDRG